MKQKFFTLVISMGLLTAMACAGAAGQPCGTRGAGACQKDQFCNFPLSARCGFTDRPGVCEKRRVACTKDARLVCGCDHKTYFNACLANAAGVSVLKPGKC